VIVKHEFARKLRREQANVERKLWPALRGRQFAGFKFRRQQPIGSYIADFVSFEVRLIVELDGDQHGSEQGIAQDRIRTQALEQDGFRIVRFPNHQASGDLGSVLETIERYLPK
jgi:very-short-patch-repair endonuclease